MANSAPGGDNHIHNPAALAARPGRRSNRIQRAFRADIPPEWEELEEELEDYQKAGVLMVWVIYPERRKARVFRLDGPPVVLMEDDVLSGEDVIPGFRYPLRGILPRRAGRGAARRPERVRPGLMARGSGVRA